MCKMASKMAPKYKFANIVIILLEIYVKYMYSFIHMQSYKEISLETLILLYKSHLAFHIFKIVYGVCCYCHGNVTGILKIVHVFRYRHTNIRMISKRMVLHVYVFSKTLKILMMASMMANSDALYAIETRKPVQQLQNVQHTNVSPAAVC